MTEHNGVPLWTPQQLEAHGLLAPSMIEEMLQEEPPRDVVKDFIRERSVNLVIGDSGIGKTPWLVTLGIAVASGRPFMGRAVESGPVIYYDAEMGQEEFLQLGRTVSAHMGLARIPETFLVYSKNWTPAEAAMSRMLMQQQIELVKPRLVIVDPVRTFFPGIDMKSDIAEADIGFQRKLAREHGCAFVNLHHRRKSNANSLNPPDLKLDPSGWLEESAGTKALINHTDLRLGIEAMSVGADLLLGGFRRSHGKLAPIHLHREFDEDGNPIGYRVVTGLETLPMNYQQAFAKLTDRFTFGQAQAALGGKSGSGTKSFTDALVEAKLVMKTGTHKKTQYHKTAEPTSQMTIN